MRGSKSSPIFALLFPFFSAFRAPFWRCGSHVTLIRSPQELHPRAPDYPANGSYAVTSSSLSPRQERDLWLFVNFFAQGSREGREHSGVKPFEQCVFLERDLSWNTGGLVVARAACSFRRNPVWDRQRATRQEPAMINELRSGGALPSPAWKL